MSVDLFAQEASAGEEQRRVPTEIMEDAAAIGDLAGTIAQRPNQTFITVPNSPHSVLLESPLAAAGR